MTITQPALHTVAVMGLGVRGKIHLHGLLENPQHFRIVGLCDLDVPKMQQVAAEFAAQFPQAGLEAVPQYTDVEQMLAETRPEVFVFVTYPDLRLSLVEMAARYGVKAISLEKPMAESLQEAARMVEVCQQHGIKAVVCHQQKYTSQFQALKQRIDAGEIGAIRKIHVETQAWFSQLGTHYVDYILWANGGHRAKWVCGHAHGPICLEDSHPAPDYLLGTMELENGVHAYVECGYLAEAHNPPEYGSSDNRLTVYGENGYVYAETDGFWGACTPATGGKLVEGHEPGWRNHQQVPIQTPYYTEFAAWLNDDAQVHSCNIETAYHGYEILEGMCLSALRNVRVDLPIRDHIGLNYEPVVDTMRQALPPCGSSKMYIYLGKGEHKERD